MSLPDARSVADGVLSLSTIAFVLVGAGVGVRLLRLAARTRNFSDFAIGFALFDLSAVAYPLTLAGGLGVLPLDAARWVYTAATLALALGWSAVFLFTLLTFRPSAAPALAFTGVGLALLAYGAAAGALFNLGATEIAQLTSAESPVFLLQLGAMAAYGWTALEAFSHWLRARRRSRLGVVDPLRMNRLFWWMCFGVFALLSLVPGTLAGVRGEDVIADASTRLAISIAGLGCAVALQLAFLPPRFYRAWITRSRSS
jgi:hypothetical protein